MIWGYLYFWKHPSKTTKNNQPQTLRIAEAFGDKFGNGVMALSAFLGGFACAFGLGWLMALVMCA